MLKKSNFYYALTWFFGRPILDWGMNIHSTGGENLPEKGPVLLLSNHISHFDPPLVGYGLRRAVDFLASAEFFENKWVNRFFRSINTYPFKRDQAQDLTAMRWVRTSLNEDRVVCIFPERGIRYGEKSVLAGKLFPPGTAEVAFRWGVTVIPTVVLGSDHFYTLKAWKNRQSVYVTYLPAIHPQDFKSAAEMNRAIGESMHQEVRRLKRIYDLNESIMPIAAEEHWGKPVPA